MWYDVMESWEQEEHQQSSSRHECNFDIYVEGKVAAFLSFLGPGLSPLAIALSLSLSRQQHKKGSTTTIITVISDTSMTMNSPFSFSISSHLFIFSLPFLSSLCPATTHHLTVLFLHQISIKFHKLRSAGQFEGYECLYLRLIIFLSGSEKPMPISVNLPTHSLCKFSVVGIDNKIPMMILSILGYIKLVSRKGSI